MTTIEDLKFQSHPAGYQAIGLFENGWGVSVVPESDMVHYEVAIMQHENGIHSHITYESGLTDDVLRYLTHENVSEVIAQAQSLSPRV